jgi:hypothetical protein
MKTEDLAKFAGLTIFLSVGLFAVIVGLYRTSIAASWEESRCKPYVIPFSALFKPTSDPRSVSQFARDNWSFCQKEYIQSAIRVAAEEVQGLANAEAAVADVASDTMDTISNTFYLLWKMCHMAFSAIMDRFHAAAKLLRNMMNNLYGMVDRLQGIIFSIAMTLISFIMAIIDTIQVTVMVAIIIIGIVLVLQIILFYLFAPISGLILTVSTLVLTVTTVVATAILASEVGGACFAPDTPIRMNDGEKPISDIQIGDRLHGGAVVLAVHEFYSNESFYDINGVKVTGDHLIVAPETGLLIPVSKYPTAKKQNNLFGFSSTMYCLTTSNRRIPVLDLQFADWEEINDEDTAGLNNWYNAVWTKLNPLSVHPGWHSDAFLHSDSGFSPDCLVQRKNYWNSEWVAASSIKIGDSLVGSGRIIGIVELDAKQVDKVYELPTSQGVQLVSCGTWIHYEQVWQPITGFRIAKTPPGRFLQFYTTKGTVELFGGWLIRDASDVGLSELRPLVESIIINPDMCV